MKKVFYSVINAVYRNSRKVYKYCYKELDHNIINLQKYLDKCKLYRNSKSSDKPEGSQQTLSILISAMPETKADHWKRAGMTVYMINLPFNHYENKYIRDHLHHINHKYVPPSDIEE